MADLTAFNEIVPAVNQVETHPFFQQEFLNTWMKKLNIQHESWGPLAEHRVGELLQNPIIKAIAEKHGKTPVQVVLRFNVQRGIVVIPKSSNKERIKENINIFDFTLTEDDMIQIRTLDEDKSLWLAYDDPSIVEMAMADPADM